MSENVLVIGDRSNLMIVVGADDEPRAYEICPSGNKEGVSTLPMV